LCTTTNRQIPRTLEQTSIQFTKEIEENGNIPFLDCLVTRKTTAYRLHDQTSYNPTPHKVTTIFTLTRRAQIVCDSQDSLTIETKHLNTVFIKNDSTDFIERNTYLRPNDSSNNLYTTIYRHYTLHTRDLRNHSMHTTTLQHPSCRKNPCSLYKQFTRSNAPTTRPLILVRPAET